MRPAGIVRHLDLRRPQRGSGPEPLLEQTAVKHLHELRCGEVVDFPQARDLATAELMKVFYRGLLQQSLAFDRLAKSGLARAQHDEISIESHVVDVMQADIAVLRHAL